MIAKQKIPTLEEAFSGTLFGEVGKVKSGKQIVMLDPKELIEIEDQPFHPYPPEKLQEMAEDIKDNGQLNPCTVRKKDGQYFVLAGRNRKRACELAGIKAACIVIECDNATADLILVNSNLNQRQELLPSEKALAYKMQKEAYEAKGMKKTIAAVAEQNSENVKRIQRYIKLTKLSPTLMKMVDGGRIPVTAGVELAYLPEKDMTVVSSYLRRHPDFQVDLNQVQTIRKLAEESEIDDEILNEVFYGESVESEKPEKKKREKKAIGKVKSVSFKISELEEIGSRYDFENATSSQIKHYILGSLEAFFKK
jgi:ParB family chromosome partitioning protein